MNLRSTVSTVHARIENGSDTSRVADCRQRKNKEVHYAVYACVFRNYRSKLGLCEIQDLTRQEIKAHDVPVTIQASSVCFIGVARLEHFPVHGKKSRCNGSVMRTLIDRSYHYTLEGITGRKKALLLGGPGISVYAEGKFVARTV